MKHAWHVGRIAGIDLRIHWTFAILPIWIFFSTLASGGGGFAAAVSVLFIFALFGCVVLHELGHCLTARVFGIPTRDITLLPIGGVASLLRMPRDPWRELAIAVAGPAVNVVIAAALWLSLPVLVASGGLGNSALSFLDQLMWVNVVLVVFNMLPAFPMDGGRVLRAMLAFVLPYTRATKIAVRVGQGIAILLCLTALWTGHLLLLLLAGFVFLAARAEALMVSQSAERFGSGDSPGEAWVGESFGGDRGEREDFGSPDGSWADASSASSPSIHSPITPSAFSGLPVVSAQWNAKNVLGWLSHSSVDEFLVSSQGVVVAVIRKCDLLHVVSAGLGALPLERLMAGQIVPFRTIRPDAAV